ncbi:MAG TPA: DUF503 domain-containing protein [Sedimentibacter sp.]|jgi:uncharacterized protein YlxP (DUF503 family)|nr:DUF503 domain-containing protein [Sedimentibacter sp.]HHZ00448.1 DUF503 domain-containing protein [Tissierellia bacterium]HOK49233.1 DUF503 domain-containing protein [Sedimentibacter sp.]HOW23077.1 DUF503 domain-containing protein [Sedimentibacter sp.]HRC80473.1 DUF503 domain-containing protein [Sedimentibacter sp.]
MIVCSCEIEILIYEANSLKEKRHVIKSIIERIRSKFNASVAEVGYNELWNRSLLGIAVVSNTQKMCDASISRIITFIDNDERVEIINCYREII